MNEQKIVGYDVKNRITGLTKRYKTSRAASNAMHRADNEYGAYICTRRAIWA